MSAKLERMDSEDFEHVIQPVEDVKEDANQSEKRDKEDLVEEEVGKKTEKTEEVAVEEV
jgi:hypothetical protein